MIVGGGLEASRLIRRRAVFGVKEMEFKESLV
jgi:hypothetical protein